MRVPHWEELQTDIEVRLAGKKRRASAPREAHAHRHEQCHLLLDTVQHMIVPEAINLYQQIGCPEGASNDRKVQAQRIPGSYFVFCQRTHAVLASIDTSSVSSALRA
jgi:hypothetical protein